MRNIAEPSVDAGRQASRHAACFANVIRFVVQSSLAMALQYKVLLSASLHGELM